MDDHPVSSSSMVVHPRLFFSESCHRSLDSYFECGDGTVEIKETMLSSFQKPSSLALCVLSILWSIAAIWFATSFVLGGNFLGAVIMALFGFAAIGLWFQSRVAAWTLIVFAGAGIIFALFSIGHGQGLRIATRLCFAIWSLALLFEFLKNETRS
jgi:hypothetical protein